MSDLLWQKPGVAVDAQIQAFLAGDDVLLDREFFLHDIAASAAHAEGLQRIGILGLDELGGLKRELATLAEDFRSGAFVLDERFEDGHSAIEARLTERLGDAGRKIHTGRSRNDQVLVATRLWLKEKLAQVAALSREIAKVALDRALAEKHLPIPGYTHVQRAVVSSAGMWWAGWAEAFLDDAVRARDTAAWIDANPLGSAAGYGINLPLDRDGTTRALGFGRLQVAATYAQLSRGKFELAALEALGSAMLDLRRVAWDLSLFTSAEFGFVALPPEYVTVRRGPVDGLLNGVSRTWEVGELTVRMFGRMVVGQASLKNLSGPLSIAEFAGESASDGAMSFLNFLVLISLSLGFLNLLPIPILDGGQVVFQLVEWLKGSPLSERAQVFGQQIGIALLILMMGVALFNDVARQIGPALSGQ